MKKLLGWVKEYGYFYKITALVATAVLCLAVYLIVHYATLVIPDYTVVIAAKGESLMISQQEAIRESLEKYGEDLNGDGKVAVEILYSALYTDRSNANAYGAEVARLSAEINSDRWSVLIFDSEAYLKMQEMKLLKDDSYKNADGTFSAWNWKGSGFKEEVYKKSATDADLYFASREPGGNEKTDKRSSEGVQLIERIKNAGK